MKKNLFFFFLLSYSLQLSAQTLHVDSTRYITGINPGTYINYAIPTSNKGILFTGYATPNPGGIIPYFPYGYNNLFIGKIDSNQTISWIKIYGGSQDDAASCAIQTPDGGYAVLCGTASNDGNVTGFKGVSDLWLIRLDPSGTLLWQKCYGSTMQDAPISIATTADNGFILLGLTNGSDGDVPFHYGSTWLFDWAVIKTDSAGTVQWSKNMGGTAAEGFGSILAVDNGYYIACTSASIDGECTDTAWHPAIPGTGTQLNYFLVRLDSAGNKLWDRSYGGSNGENIVYSMFDSRDSSIVMMGSTGSPDYMVTGFHPCLGNGDMWIVKVNKNGTLIWQKTLGSVQDESGTGICPAPNGGYMAYGGTFPTGGCSDGTIGNIGNHDCWLFLLDSSGNIVTNKIFGGILPELTYSIVPYLNGYAALGNSGSYAFTEGTTYGNFDTSAANPNGGGAFVSYIGYSSLSVNNFVYGVNEPAMSIYPNPAQNEVKIIGPTGVPGKITISNTLGQIVYTRTVKGSNKLTEIATEGWVNGLYVVQWHGVDGEILMAKLIKN